MSVLHLDLPRVCLGPSCLGLHCLSCSWGFSPPFLVALLCCFVISGCYWIVLFCFLFLLLLSDALGDPDGRTFPLYISFLALVAVGLRWSVVLLSACASSAFL